MTYHSDKIKKKFKGKKVYILAKDVDPKRKSEIKA